MLHDCSSIGPPSGVGSAPSSLFLRSSCSCSSATRRTNEPPGRQGEQKCTKCSPLLRGDVVIPILPPRLQPPPVDIPALDPPVPIQVDSQLLCPTPVAPECSNSTRGQLHYLPVVDRHLSVQLHQPFNSQASTSLVCPELTTALQPHKQLPTSLVKIGPASKSFRGPPLLQGPV